MFFFFLYLSLDSENKTSEFSEFEGEKGEVDEEVNEEEYVIKEKEDINETSEVKPLLEIQKCTNSILNSLNELNIESIGSN